MIHGRFADSDALAPILTAPYTEFAVVTPKPGHHDVVANILTHLVAAMNEPSCPAVGGTFGPVIETEGNYLLLIGWQTVEVRVCQGPRCCVAAHAHWHVWRPSLDTHTHIQEHWDSVKSMRSIEELLGNAEVKITHVKLIAQ
ncbi:hypothetical protein DENSPDRAFT_838852 [Dentipellis sp. KUC8613]|nr:hypothetical protein DENSPDRAFT_838852 [Dentipellis sp. KUC8613]